MRGFGRFVLLLFVGCHRASAPSDAATNSVTPLPSTSASSATPSTPTAPVGLATFAPPPPAAVAKNDHGVTLLSNGKPAEAIPELEGALAIAPDFTLARYNLACARARAADFDGAGRELAEVFEADFVGMRAHALEDSDLAPFWKSPQGAQLTARIPSYEARYRAVIDRGVRAILWRAGAGTRGIVNPSLVRVGVFDPDTRRFVAVAPPSHEAFFGFSASVVPYAVVATGSVRDMLGGDLDAGKNLKRVLVYPISTAGTPVATFDANAEPQVATLSIGAAGASLYVYATDSGGTLYDGAWSSPISKKTVKSAQLKLSRERPLWIEVGYNHWGYLANESDPAYAYEASKLMLRSGTGTAIEIPKKLAFYSGAARVVASPSGDRVALVWNAATLRCDSSQIPGHFKMALVSTKMSPAAVTSLGEGDGAGAVAFTKSGRMFVQRGTRVVEVSAAGEAPLPQDVRLVPDLARDDECGF